MTLPYWPLSSPKHASMSPSVNDAVDTSMAFLNTASNRCILAALLSPSNPDMINNNNVTKCVDRFGSSFVPWVYYVPMDSDRFARPFLRKPSAAREISQNAIFKKYTVVDGE